MPRVTALLRHDLGIGKEKRGEAVKRLISILLLLAGCADQPHENLADQIKDVTAKTQSAFFDLGAQYGAKCALAFAVAVELGQIPPDTQECITRSKKEYWEKRGLREVKS